MQTRKDQTAAVKRERERLAAANREQFERDFAALPKRLQAELLAIEPKDLVTRY